ncbi:MULTISPECIES: diguanylate cyclase [unclassified Herbaspirillum]|uniref:diguanylate cyclase n=1 Tax=unclassified Herbaspirillum TaxID=2624150 RepID=UPI0011545A7F|nr:MULTISPECIES: diguanylate cyclase [unclassified Herbaspirillum]MBB5392803.1 diguanylate cyclase (GGDEF)-like protein [Herbaspirillum sp. SJZ102]TQK04549.1 diguanylate cyclase (GGDEF)-like protein [Herbaspirillum sp. SJZ130]TQK09665.1 diguanylate cyclase (GGDEF)-like protein [Herbaspirillum sp. SJZ106]TWC64081.1 diguanylate cyclase (GGDEF)-like protein [Herbaspirillum sp. SJZ099]
MSLTRLFRLISIALLMLFLALAVSLVWIEWNIYRSSTNTIPALKRFRLGLIAMEQVSIERGPSNAFMGARDDERALLYRRLQAARSASDAALADLRTALEKDPAQHNSSILKKIGRVQQAMGPARAAVDRIGRQPQERRSHPEIVSAVKGMVDVIPMLVRITGELVDTVDLADPDLRDGLSGVRAAASLREYAGQVGSCFTAALITHRRLNPDEVIEIGRLYGRIELLRSLLGARLASYSSQPQFVQGLANLDRQYFDDGFQFIDHLLQVGLKSGDYGITPAELAARYVPRMKAIFDLRDIILDDLMARAEHRNLQARNLLALVIGLTIVACLFFQLLMYMIRKRVVSPLVAATDLVVGLADGKLGLEIPAARHDDEIGGMMRALRVLKERILERNSLAREREALISQLQTSSNTDFLTGLLNRRAFFSDGEQQMRAAQRYRRNLSVVLFDIDHFKRINDSYGHLSGDAVLRGVAQIAAQLLRKVDVLARYGGEEFIVLLPEADIGKAETVAQKLRAALEAKEFDLDGGQRISISASFGVAALGAGHSLEQLIKLADTALYLAKERGRNRVEVSI